MTSTSILPKQRRFLEIDYLRGVAAISVMLFHYTYGYDNGLNNLRPDRFYFLYGNLGVQLFFMISGFVILMTLEKTANSEDFLVSRFSRLYPSYWGAIVLTIAFVHFVPTLPNFHGYSAKQIAINSTMLQHWLKIDDIDGSYWTLAVELTFYVLMWLVFYLRQLGKIEIISVAWLVLSLCNSLFEIPFSHVLRQIFILPYAPLFVAGIVFYNIRTKGGYTPLRLFLHAFSLIVEAVIMHETVSTIYKNTDFWTPFSIVMAIYVLFYLLASNKISMGYNKTLLFLGTISYSLYLVHETIGVNIIYHLKQISDRQIFYIPITMGIAILLGYLLTACVEKPAMRFLRGAYKRRLASREARLAIDPGA